MQIDGVFVVDKSDKSDLHDRYNKYNPNCSCCWLGFPHTINKHSLSLNVDEILKYTECKQ